MKRILIILFALLLIAAIAFGVYFFVFSDSGLFQDSPAEDAPAGDSQTEEPAPAEKLSLSGDWVQINADSVETYYTARISRKSMEVYYTFGEFTDLYWCGSFKSPTDSSDFYSWESQKQASAQSVTWVTSEADSKVFTYSSGILSFPIKKVDKEFIVEMELGTTPSVRSEETKEEPQQDSEAGQSAAESPKPASKPVQMPEAEVDPKPAPQPIPEPELEFEAESAPVVTPQAPATTPSAPTQTAPTTPSTSAPSGNYVGSSLTKKLHGPTCRLIENIPPENVVWFETRQGAVQQGYSPCETCGGY